MTQRGDGERRPAGSRRIPEDPTLRSRVTPRAVPGGPRRCLSTRPPRRLSPPGTGDVRGPAAFGSGPASRAAAARPQKAPRPPVWGRRVCVRACVRAVARQKLRSRSAAPGASPGPPPPPQPRAGGRGEDIRIAEGAGLPPPPAAGHGGGQSGAGRRCSGARPEGHTARRGHCAAGGRQRGVCVPCRAVPCRTVCVLSSCNFAPARHLGFVIFFFFLPIYLFIRPHFLFSLPFLFLDFFFPPFPPPPFIFSFMFPFHLPFISPCISPRVFSLLLTSPLRGGRARSRRQQPVAGAVTEPHGCRPRRSRRRLLLLLAAAARPGSPRGRDVTKGRAYAPWKLRRLSVPS